MSFQEFNPDESFFPQEQQEVDNEFVQEMERQFPIQSGYYPYPYPRPRPRPRPYYPFYPPYFYPFPYPFYPYPYYPGYGYSGGYGGGY